MLARYVRRGQLSRCSFAGLRPVRSPHRAIHRPDGLERIDSSLACPYHEQAASGGPRYAVQVDPLARSRRGSSVFDRNVRKALVSSPTITAVVGVFATLLAGTTMGLGGFGYGLVTTPLLIMVLPPRVAVPTIGVHTTLTSLALVWRLWGHVRLKRIWPLLLAGAATVPFGALLLLVLGVGPLKVLIGSVTALTAVALLAGFKREIRSGRLAGSVAGLMSGLLNGSTGMGAPPVILFFANQGIEKHVFRANLSAYFATVNLVRMATYAVGGLFTPTVLSYTALLLPTGVIGLFLGIRLAKTVDEKPFRRAVLLVTVLSGALGIISGLGLV